MESHWVVSIVESHLTRVAPLVHTALHLYTHPPKVYTRTMLTGSQLSHLLMRVTTCTERHRLSHSSSSVTMKHAGRVRLLSRPHPELPVQHGSVRVLDIGRSVALFPNPSGTRTYQHPSFPHAKQLTTSRGASGSLCTPCSPYYTGRPSWSGTP